MNLNMHGSLSRPRPWQVLGLLLACGLAACGGGGGGDSGMPPPPPPPPPPTLTLAVQPGNIVLGQSAQLSWKSSDGTSCTASGGWSGTEPASGSQAVTPSSVGAVVYTLMCAGAAYTGSSTQSATLTVSAPSAYSNTLLVANAAGGNAQSVDSHLVNPWGLALGPTSPMWVANAATASSTIYDGNGKAQPVATPRVVALAPSAGGAAFSPTGMVFNGSADFVVAAAGKSAPAAFIFAGEGGMIAGWAASVDGTHALTMFADTGGAVYKGLAIASNGSANFLYAADFAKAKVDVFDASYQKQAPSAGRFAFSDANLPAGYAPFGIQAIKNGAGGSTQLYVSYARQGAAGSIDNVNGAGLGLVNVFDANGVFVRRLVDVGGALNSPWGMALAPADFGTLSNALLVGNFGDGRIHAYDPASGAFVGTLGDAAGVAFALPGLWGLSFGNDASNQPHNTLFYAAGVNDESGGAYGRIDLGATPPVLNVPPVVSLTVPTGSLAGTVTLSATVQDALRISKVEFFANGSQSLGVATSSPYTISWDTTLIADGSAAITATATNVNNAVGSSAAVNVTVANHAPAAPTLTQLQQQVFTARCSGCHDGSQPAGGALPGSQNLSAGSSFAALVNVDSLEQPSLKRVKPGDAANSYLIRKLEGGPGISGARMPFGGPYLDAATIEQIKAWIAAGAPNN